MNEIDYDDVRPELKKFVIDMENKLRKNDYKVDWTKCSYNYLIEQFNKQYESIKWFFDNAEGKQLDAPLYQHPFMKPNVIIMMMGRNALVNAANYSMMLVDKIDKQTDELCDTIKDHDKLMKMYEESN